MRVRQQINEQLNNKKTGAAWAKQFNINFITKSGFPSEKYFDSVLINLEDFTTLASTCEVKKPEITTRRDANKLKKTLNWNLQ